MTDSKKNVKSEKIRRWFEPIGLFLLLAAFGWQCMEEQSSQMKYEGYMLEMNEKLVSLWEATFDEAIHSERYHGNTTVAVNYDALNSSFKYWNQVQEEMATIERQESFFFNLRILLYIIGSIMIISSKIPKKELI